MDERGPIDTRATYRAFLLRGLEPAEAANLTAFLHGLPSTGIHWRLAEVEAIVRRRAAHRVLRPLSHDDLPIQEPATRPST